MNGWRGNQGKGAEEKDTANHFAHPSFLATTFPLSWVNPKGFQPRSLYMAHTDYLQSNYSNTIFWLVSLFEMIFSPFSLFLKRSIR